MSNAWPPCLHGKVAWALAHKGVGPPTKMPTVEEMTRDKAPTIMVPPDLPELVEKCAVM